MKTSHDDMIGLYERHAREFDRDRSRSLQEKAWLDRFLACVRPSGTVLDLGCGMGEPIARYIIDAGFRIVGVDSSTSLIDMGRTRFPDSEWLVADMRNLALGRRFDGILAWDSFFHLRVEEQHAMFERFAAHALPGAALMFTSGHSEGEACGSYCGEPLYHASLDPESYERLLETHGFTVHAHVVDDPGCGGHTVWLAVLDAARGARPGS
jgi:SAM-dependent methyltransferase